MSAPDQARRFTEAEEDPGASRDEMRSVLATIPDYVLRVGLDGKIQFINRTNPGVSMDQVVGSPISSWIHPDYRAAVQALLDDAAATGLSAGIETRGAGPTGAVSWYFMRVGPVLENGRVASLILVSEDITERKRAEEAVSRQEGLLSSILENSTAVVYVKDREGRLLKVNRQYEKIFGVTREQVLGRTDHELFPGHVADTWRRNDLEIMETQRAIQYEEVVPETDGLHTYVSVKFPILDTSGAVTGIGGISTDISERKAAEEALQVSAHALARAAERFRSVIEASPVPYALNDDQRNITYLNPAFVRTFGYTLSDIPTLTDWWPRAYPDLTYRQWVASEWAKRLATARANGVPFEPMELEVRAKDGSPRTVIVSAASLGEAFAGTHLVVLYDVTKAKQLEGERRKLEERLSRAQRMESIGRLAGGVAHDNNNMLSVILSHAEVALQNVAPSNPLHADLLAIREAARRSANLTRQLLAHARQQTIAPRVLDVGNTVTQAMTLIQRLIGENVSLTVRSAPKLWSARIDPTQVEQILTNLCVNARDAIGGVGKVVLSTENVVLTAADALAHPGSAPGEYVLLSVEDDGSGMPPEVLEHVFEPFFTTKALGEGTGLGLATVYGIVTQNGGFILVDSTPGRGTRFSIHLPRHPGAAESAPSPEPGSRPTRRHETLLLVEDEAELLDIIGSKLARMGYTVLSAAGPQEAVRLARGHEGGIDLLVTDVIMPDMNGRELAATLLERQPRLECLFVSGYPADVIAREGVLEEGVHFLQKPFTPADLDAKIRSILARQTRQTRQT